MVRDINLARRTIGVNFDEDKRAEILLWAPYAEEVRINITELDVAIALAPQDFGYWLLSTDLLHPGQTYTFEITNKNGLINRPDPSSLLQPEGVHGDSQAVDLSLYPFTDHAWKGMPLASYIIYELHVGTFTQEGNFLGVEQKLDYLIDLGINAIALMPIAAFPGQRNWGYDGVYPFAVQESYGGPLGLQNLINVCHKKGLSVILDVVYNHFGPEGNYMEEYAPYFTDKYHTPWGKAINFDDAFSDGVRHFFIENVMMWFRDFHVDALRLDAVHAIKDLGAKHILAEIREQVDLLSKKMDRDYHLIVECDLNDPKFTNPIAQNGYGMNAQWLDEFHHSLRVAAGQPRDGYYADFNGIEQLAKSYHDAYVYDGIFSTERQKTFGQKATHNLGEQFIVFSQNHDQVGNRLLGERTSVLVSFEMQKLMAGAVTIAPYLPLFFMGEEWGAPSPFLYFVSHSDSQLIEAVRKGRAEEFKALHLDREAPDPQQEETFLRSKLQWDLLADESRQQMLSYYKALIALRKSNPVLRAPDRKRLKTSVHQHQQCLAITRWNETSELYCLLNFSAEVQEVLLPEEAKWVMAFNSAETTYGGKSKKQLPDALHTKSISAPESLIIYTKIND